MRCCMTRKRRGVCIRKEAIGAYFVALGYVHFLYDGFGGGVWVIVVTRCGIWAIYCDEKRGNLAGVNFACIPVLDIG